MKKTMKELVIESRQGNQESFASLYSLCYPEMYKIAYRLCNYNDADAQEMVQEAFLSAFKNIHTLEKVEYFKPWLRRIVHSKCVRMFYRNRDALYDPESLHRSMLVENRIDHLPDLSINNRTDQEVIRCLTNELSPKLKEILDLYYFQQKSLKEISRLIHIPEGTVKSRLYQARKLLQEKIEKFERMEQRKISFHMDILTPSFFTIILIKISSSKVMQNLKFIQTAQIASAATLVVVSTVTVVETKQYIVNHPIIPSVVQQKEQKQAQKTPEELEVIDFPTLTYEQQEVTSPKYAYYILLSAAPEAKDIEKLSREELQKLQPIVSALKTSNTYYVEVLQDNGWLSTYEMKFQA